MQNSLIHPSAIVDTDQIGIETRIWAFVHIEEGVKVGANCNICDHCFIEHGVEIGNNVTIKCGIYIWNGVKIEDNVFLGPNVVFTNDVRPRSKQYKPVLKTVLCEGCSIGANSSLLAGITIGKYTMTGIGSVITRSVPDYALVYGNPAKWRAWIDEKGNELKLNSEKNWVNDEGTIFVEYENGLRRQA